MKKTRKDAKSRPAKAVAKAKDDLAPFYVYVQGVRRKIQPVANDGTQPMHVDVIVRRTWVMAKPPRRPRRRGKRA